MSDLKILRRDGDDPIVVSADATELAISEPVSDLANLNEVIPLISKLERLSLYTIDLGSAK